MSFYNVDNWLKFREEALAYTANKERTVIKEWLDKIGYTDPVGYYRDSLNHVIQIYSTRPGVLIGKAGVNVEELSRMLLETFGRDYKVTFVEIRGGFVNA